MITQILQNNDEKHQASAEKQSKTNLDLDKLKMLI